MRLASLGLVAQSGQGPLVDWGWISRHGEVIVTRLANHTVFTLIAVGIGFAISLALSLLIVRQRWLYGPVASVAGILYTIPSLALFAILVTITGPTVLTAEIALVSYTLLILIRNTVAGLDSVPRDVREAAVGMGLSPLQVLLRVDLPLALPVIVAGLRVATVTTIGLVTISALIGMDNLGTFITDGLQRLFMTQVLLGAVLAIALAVAADLVLLGVQHLIAPWTRSRTAR
ncbi:MAG: ABC transporter permease [Sporichthyaceae bacterium]|nr:ABC transporter permease [Sporichthyaceae bacterium]